MVRIVTVRRVIDFDRYLSLPQSSINSACTFDYQCLTNQSLLCVSDTNPSSCQCDSNYWYNSSQCTPKFPAGTPCSSSAQCDDTRLLTCNSTALTCSCNETVRIWDGTNCIPRRTIGGACSSNIGCIASQNLICATSGVWTGTCACPTDYYWDNSTAVCAMKKLWNQTCASLYECYDGGYLSCQPSAALNRTVCDCGSELSRIYLSRSIDVLSRRLYAVLDRISKQYLRCLLYAEDQLWCSFLHLCVVVSVPRLQLYYVYRWCL